MLDLEKVKHLYDLCSERVGNNIKCFRGMDKPLPMISEYYPGVWLETSVYGAILYALGVADGWEIAENTVNIFIDHQTEDGQLPCYLLDANADLEKYHGAVIGYSQIQECVSFARLCLMVYEQNKDKEFLEKCYRANKAWDGWLRRNRMTTGRGLIEMFCGYDTGHDNSGRFPGLVLKGNYFEHDGIPHNASEPFPDDPIAPVLAVDMNCNFYADNVALSRMAEALGLESEAEMHLEAAKSVKEKLFKLCFDKEDGFFYDVDKNGSKIRCRSSTVFHLFLEGVLDPAWDKELISEIYVKYLSNPKEFATPYPFPSVSASDPSFRKHTDRNCWGYFSQGLIALRTTRWMERYGFTEAFESLLTK